MTSKGPSVYVMVLGDMGHSPRMCNHALSSAEEGFNVTYVGYKGSALSKDIRLHPNIQLCYLHPYPKSLSKFIPKIFNYLFKAIWQSLTILWVLPFLWGPDYILLQNPPSIPALPILSLYCFFHRWTSLVLDWHNYGWSILALSLGEYHFLVRFSKWCERVFGSRASHSFCVSRAMKEDLRLNYNIHSAKVLYDRPSEAFRSISVQERHRLSKKILEFKDPLVNSGTLFTEEFARDRVTLREDRPGLLVSSTSWTEDEDFGILLDALQVYNDTSCDNSVGFLPHLICVITGKGPMKDKYKAIIASRNWQRVTVITPWLEPEDYPLMIASADLGVCLHTSSSGLDLPMKVVDMFGCGLPVAAVNYPTLSELIKDGENGIVFDTSYELAEIIMSWFKGFPEQTESKYNTFSSNLEEYQCLRWSDYWCTIARPVFKPE